MPSLADSCALITAGSDRGTAYLVGTRTVATCHHVIESVGEGAEVELAFAERTVTGHVGKFDQTTDCALIDLDEAMPVELVRSLAGPPAQKTQWDGYGFPALTVSSGLSLFGLVLDPSSRDDLRRPMITLYSDMVAAGMAAPINGFSGGPVIVNGSVIGHFSRVVSDPGAPGRSALGVVYAATASNVLKLLGALPPPPAPATAPVPLLAETIPALPAGEYHAFISHRSTDRAFARALYERLDGAGFRVFLDERELVLGDSLAGVLHEAMAKSRTGIVLVSKAWRESTWCVEEGNTMVSRAIQEPSRFRVIPLRIDSTEIPPIFQSRLWLDFSEERAPVGPKLDQVMYAVLGLVPPQGDTAEHKARVTRTAAADEALKRIDSAKEDPAKARPVVDFLKQNGLPSAAASFRLAQALIGVARPEAAFEVLSVAPEDSLRARQLRALALSKSDRHDAALEILEPLFESGEANDAETGGILGGIYKRMWNATPNRVYLIKSIETYRRTYQLTGDSYPGINLATLAFLDGETAEAHRVASAIVEDLGHRTEAEIDQWKLATLAEAFLILDRRKEAAAWYMKATAAAYRQPADIAVMRRQARRLLAKLGGDPKVIEDALPVPRVIAFSGHMTDAPGRAIPRFSEDHVAATRDRIEAWLRANGGVVHAVCSAARGGDLVFLETVLELRGTATVLLPFPEADFKKSSVGSGLSRNGKTWVERFDAVLKCDRVVTRKPLMEKAPPPPEQPAAFARCNDTIVEEAERLANLFDDAAPTLLTLLTKGAADGRGGTADMVKLWKKRNHPSVNIDPGTA